jgi:hypothetical protein
MTAKDDSLREVIKTAPSEMLMEELAQRGEVLFKSRCIVQVVPESLRAGPALSHQKMSALKRWEGFQEFADSPENQGVDRQTVRRRWEAIKRREKEEKQSPGKKAQVR